MSSELLKDTHSLLARQLRRSQVTASSLDETTKQLLESVNTAYQDFDRTREMLERSLELSSQELRQANAELRVLLDQRSAAEKEMEVLHAQRLEATGLLAGGVAHDFNNLLAVIKGSCEVLMKLPAPEDLQRELVRQIETAAARAAALTKQLLVFSRRQVLEPREIDLNVTIAGLEHIYQPLVGDDIELRWALDPKLPTINADPAQIEQVLVNLIVNARDAMPSGGTLELQTTRASAAETRAHGAGNAALVRLSVKDTGSGMSSNVKSRIFEPFFTTKA
ncbi:MAG TPA: histidine kinase dimerization/phospho-acceptor domain-containing protein, partial [Polyangiaceae bacterium]|nr:histidine kinase dimerization/phospho-acceptor domain-containing protein [Polyangiaceae bacterium]